MKRGMIKLLLSIFATACASVSLVASTFAYVLINNKVIVPDFDFNIKGQEGLEISLDNKNWSKDILATSIKEKIFNDNNEYYNQNNITSFDEIKFSCTSIDMENGVIQKDANNQIKFHYDEVIGEKNQLNITEYRHINTPAHANEDKGYIKFDLYLKSKSTFDVKKDFKLYMTDDTNVTASRVDEVKVGNRLSTLTKDYLPGDTISVDISNAIRLGVYNVFEDDNNNFTNYKDFVIYEKINEHDLGGVALESHRGLNDRFDPEKNAMFTYYNNYFVKYPFLTGVDEGEAFDTLSKDELLTTSFGDFKYNETKNDYNVIKLEIYIWLEGWDADYFVGVPNDTTIRVDLGFEIKE